MSAHSETAGLLTLVCCPACHGDLERTAAGFSCTRCRQTYSSYDGVPMLARSAASHSGSLGPVGRLRHALLANHVVYDFAQRHGGGVPLAHRVAAHLRTASGQTVLDIGGGTGSIAALLPENVRYVWLDNDTLKLRGLRARGVADAAVLGDAAALPFRDDAVDLSVMMEVSHHLPDAALAAALGEVSRVTRDRFVFLDLLRSNRLTSKVLCALDLGEHARSESELRAALEVEFTVTEVERFRVHHDHILCICIPRKAR